MPKGTGFDAGMGLRDLLQFEGRTDLRTQLAFADHVEDGLLGLLTLLWGQAEPLDKADRRTEISKAVIGEFRCWI